MSLIGIFHYRKDPSKVSRAYRYASIAKMEGLDIFYFTAKRVDFERKIIKGLIYENGEWIEKEFPFPNVIINHVGPITKFQNEVYNKLKKMIPFTSNPVGTKLSVYNKIKKGEEFANHLIPYKYIKKPIDVFVFLNDHPKVILKPISGHHGNEILYLEKNENQFIINENGNIKTFPRLRLYNYLVNLIREQKMLVQKFIDCKTNTGEPYDIRLHIQKDQNGCWQNIIIYPRVGFKNKIATNLSQGGKITDIVSLLKTIYGDEYFDIFKYLEVFALQFSKHFETLYKHQFDELGIDIGIDENKKVWIYEVNWRPGHLYIESKASRNAVLYAYYLAYKNNKGEFNENNEIK